MGSPATAPHRGDVHGRGSGERHQGDSGQEVMLGGRE
jgi:hypothetical protein